MIPKFTIEVFDESPDGWFAQVAELPNVTAGGENLSCVLSGIEVAILNHQRRRSRNAQGSKSE